MRSRSFTCQCNCWCPGCRLDQPRPGGENPLTHGGELKPRSEERPPVAGQDLGQRPRHQSLVVLGLSSVGKAAVAFRACSFQILATTPLLLKLGLIAPVVWLFFSSERSVSYRSSSSPEDLPSLLPLSHSLSSGNRGNPGVLGCWCQCQHRQSESVGCSNRAHSSLSLPFCLLPSSSLPAPPSLAS